MALYHTAFLVVLATVAAPADATLFAQLMSVQYKNNGTVHSSDAFTTAGINCLYLEPEQVTTPRHSWADGSGTPHIYMFAAAAENATCADASPQPGMDRPGSDLSQVASSASPDACGRSCCGNPACAAWVFAPEAPATWQGCTKGVSCCYLKSAAGATSPKAGLTSGAVTRAGGPTAAPPSKGTAPPSRAPRSALHRRQHRHPPRPSIFIPAPLSHHFPLLRQPSPLSHHRTTPTSTHSVLLSPPSLTFIPPSLSVFCWFRWHALSGSARWHWRGLHRTPR